VYRGEVHGQLPFDAKGMDNPVPIIDFSPAGSTDSPYTLERGDVEGCIFVDCRLSIDTHPFIDVLGLFRVLDDLEEFARSSNDHAALGAVKESRGALEKLVHRMDSLESGFDRIAERSRKHILLMQSYLLMIDFHPSIIGIAAFCFSTTVYVHCSVS
jgi:autophagy-related protein 11